MAAILNFEFQIPCLCDSNTTFDVNLSNLTKFSKNLATSLAWDVWLVGNLWLIMDALLKTKLNIYVLILIVNQQIYYALRLSNNHVYDT